LLGGEEGETLGEVEAHLVAEERTRAGAGAVAFLDAGFEDRAHEIKVEFHFR